MVSTFSPKKAFVKFRTLIVFPKPKESIKILSHQVTNFHPQKITHGAQTDQILLSYYSDNKGKKTTS
jgi:hypothetical protein